MRMLNLLRIKTILPWLIGGFVLGITVAMILLAGGLFTRSRSQMTIEVMPVLTIIPAPSTTPTPMASITPAMSMATPSPLPEPSGSGEISQGQLVEIFGTEGDNLRLRSQPGLDAPIAFLGVESEVFEVQGGPQEVDGYEWWFLRNPYNTEKTGWAVSVYLRSITSP